MKDINPGRVSLRQLCTAGVGLWFIGTPLQAYDINDTLSIGAVAAGAWQCQELSETDGATDACRGALPFRPHISYNPSHQDGLYVELGLAAGNGLNPVSPFQLAPWAADLEDNVKDINDRGRNYLVTAWYRHTFQIAADNSLSTTLGMIDSTDYLDINAFANDEYTQFMNEALVNSTQVLLPSYDWGAALEWDPGAWSLRAVYMNVGKAEDEDLTVDRLTRPDVGDNYDVLGLEAGYLLRNWLGEGNYRIVYSATSRDFLDPSGTRARRRAGIGISFDQELSEDLGAFIRIGTQSDDVAIFYEHLYLGGFNIRGNRWGRGNDNIGLGIAYLVGGNLDIDNTRVAEAYYRLVLDDHFALTADLQYMHDDKRVGRDPEGVILGLRADVHF